MDMYLDFGIDRSFYYFYAAQHQISAFPSDCHPKALSVIVTSDILPSSHSKSDGPNFNAEKSCDMLQKACESYGFLVLSLVNRSLQYFQALLLALADTNLGSCELYWLIFSCHGRGNEICINGECIKFDDLIYMINEAKLKNVVFFFECCMFNTAIKIAEIQTPHMVIYSAPPNNISFHIDGVGFLVRCLAEMMNDEYDKPMNDLQLELRQIIMVKLIEQKGLLEKDELIDSMSQEEFKRKHLPVHTTSMLVSLNPHTIISDGSKYLGQLIQY